MYLVKFDFFGIIEIYLNFSVLDDWIRIFGYNFVRKDCDFCGGGVLIYFKEDFIVYFVYVWDRLNIEVLWLNIIMRF